MPRTTSSRTSASRAVDWPQLDRQLCFALYSASLAMTKFYKPLLEPLGLTYPQYLVLMALWGQDDLSVGELGERLFLDSGTLTPLLKRMEVAGWLQRARDAEDERRVRVALTERGRTLRSDAQRLPQAIGAAIGGCSTDELRALTRQLQAVRAQLLSSIPPNH